MRCRVDKVITTATASGDRCKLVLSQDDPRGLTLIYSPGAYVIVVPDSTSEALELLSDTLAGIEDKAVLMKLLQVVQANLQRLPPEHPLVPGEAQPPAGGFGATPLDND